MTFYAKFTSLSAGVALYGTSQSLKTGGQSSLSTMSDLPAEIPRSNSVCHKRSFVSSSAQNLSQRWKNKPISKRRLIALLAPTLPTHQHNLLNFTLLQAGESNIYVYLSPVGQSFWHPDPKMPCYLLPRPEQQVDLYTLLAEHVVVSGSSRFHLYLFSSS